MEEPGTVGADSAPQDVSEGSRSVFRTDGQISMGSSERQRELKRFDFAAYGDASQDGALEELSGGLGSRKSSGKWDQFRVNEEKFGVVSTFKTDLSQYTTVLDKRKIPKEMKLKAERIAKELERGGACGYRDEEYEDGDYDEEDLFSAVPRTGQQQLHGLAGFAGLSSSGGNEEAGKALLASLRAAPSAARAAEGDHRALVSSKVQDWWRARQLTGAEVPPGAEVALVCPFSHRVFGDVSQLLMHWAGALPKAIDPQGAAETPSLKASQHFGRLARELRWSQMSSTSGLDASLSTTAPRPGSVWEQILARLTRDSGGSSSPGSRIASDEAPAALADRPVREFAAEAVRLKFWRREQKVEHREVLEGIAAGLAICALSAPIIGTGTPWDDAPDEQSDGGGGGGSASPSQAGSSSLPAAEARAPATSAGASEDRLTGSSGGLG